MKSLNSLFSIQNQFLTFTLTSMLNVRWNMVANLRSSRKFL